MRRDAWAADGHGLDVVLAKLRQRGASRPRAVRTPSSTIGSLFQKQLGGKDVTAILSSLGDKGALSVDSTRVSHLL